MTRTRIYDDEGTTTVAVPIPPSHVRLLPVESLVQTHLPTLTKACEAIGGRPIAGQSPQVLSEREMAQVDPEAVRWRPDMVWLAVPVTRHSGPSETIIIDPTPD